MDYFASWSGGKDCCLATYRAIEQWGLPRSLLCMLTEGDEVSRSHGLPRRLLAAQAAAIGVPICFEAATWEDYESRFIHRLRQMSAEGVRAGVFGDIDLDEHREWEERVCAAANMTAHLPIWREDHEALLSEFLEAGFSALIVTVRLDAVPENMLGERLSPAVLAKLRALGVDVSGEAGEFHTAVVEGPLFAEPVHCAPTGVHRLPGYAALRWD